MARWWPRRQKNSPPANLVDVGAGAYPQLGGANYSGVPISEATALNIAAFFRAISLISGTIAMLPMRTVRDVDGIVTPFGSVFDDPGAVIDMTPFEWKQTVIGHQLLHGDAFLAHVYNQAGGLAGLIPVHPSCVYMDPLPRRLDDDQALYEREFTARLADGSRRTFTTATMTHCPAMSLDGTGRGLSLIGVARNSLGIAVAGDRAAAKMFSQGALIGGLAVPREGESVDREDAKTITADLKAATSGWENAAALAVVNRRLELMPWTMSNEDAQFLQSRQFQVEEIARWTGVPPHLLMQTEKQTSWGTGVAEQNRGLSRYTLSHWTARLEQRLSRLLPAPRTVRFDYHEWERPVPEVEIDLLMKQTGGRQILTVNEARAARNLPPIDGGDVLDPTPAPVPATAART